MFICLECGKTFEEGEVARWREDRGEFWGFPCSEEVTGCPFCEGAYDEADECAECGKYFAKSDLDENHLCEDCRDDTDEEE